ncbi:MAG: hypothetical protein DRN96_09355 [Thermoproteota archaeon]|nr:MAG: hypothetical protein DRN96_09355 [Candidatus Korarchaeota archaeon]RLG51033.1 MAG: hypothetical protein DRN99_09025 [Candidatus Korarchaeota archaeon]
MEVGDLVLLFHYADRGKEMALAASSAVTFYMGLREAEREASKPLLKHMVETLARSLSMAREISKRKATWVDRDYAAALMHVEQAIAYIERGEPDKARGSLAQAVSSLTSIASRALQELSEIGVTL